MIELPEAVTIARQIDERLKGKRIDSALRGNSPHKFAFYSGEPEEYERILAGKEVAEARAHGNQILVSAEPGYTVVLGCGGEKILYHQTEATLPKKHQLLLRFADGSYWWAFQSLLETVCGDELGSRYGDRRPVVRACFDDLQDRWVAEVERLLAAGARPEEWDGLTERCVSEAWHAARELERDLAGS